MNTPKTILVVEDDPQGRDYLSYLLRNTGYRVEQAANGREALEKLQAFTPDLILSDVLMPEMDGLELLHRLRSGTSFALANIPVIFYSATSRALKGHPHIVGEQHPQQILKPADPEVILTAVSKALSKIGSTKPFDPALFPEEQVRVLSEQLIEKVQELTAINEKLQATTALLRSSEEQYRLLFEGNPNPMWVFDQETLCFLAVNEAAVSRYGYTREEFLKMTIRDIRPNSEQDRLDEELLAGVKRVIASEIWHHEKKDGSLLDVEIFAHPIAFNGRPAKLVMAQDLTERTRLEEQLRQAQKMEAMGQLASGVAHDFNNLLGVIMGCTELALLRLDESNPAVQKLLDVKSAAQRAAGLTRQLLLFSRQEISEPQVVNLNGSIKDFGQFLRRLIGEDIELEYVLCPEITHVTIDPGLLEQVLMNLAVNARDAMPQGGRLTIQSGQADLTSESLPPGFHSLPGRYANLSISDTGHGMTAPTLARIFEPFFTTKARGKGTGLGLATVYKIVEQAGGCITVSSEPGVGTTFRIFLPLGDSASEQAGVAETGATLSGSETILLVEDEPSLRQILQESLQQSGYKVLAAANGPEALAIADRRQIEIDLLMTDVIMPGMSGPQLVSGMLAKHPRIQVLLMSGYTDDMLVHHGLMQSASIIQKPFTHLALLQKIRAVLSQHGQNSGVTPSVERASRQSLSLE